MNLILYITDKFYGTLMDEATVNQIKREVKSE